MNVPLHDVMSETVNCADVSELLDVVATDELAGVDLKERYPAVLAHLRRCDRCRAAYFMLLDALRCQERSASLSSSSPDIASPPTLSFLDGEDERPWRRQDDEVASPFPLTFEIAHSFIQRALSGPILSGMRGEPSAYGEQQALLLADWVATENDDWIVELTAHRRLDYPEAVDLEARLISNEPLPADVRVAVQWGDQCRSALLDAQGAARLRAISLSQLVEPQSGRMDDDLTISFSVEGASESDSD